MGLLAGRRRTVSHYGAGVITLIHDPADDPEITHTALAAHDPRRGQITVHPTVGTDAALTFAFDILAALGTRITDNTASHQQLGAANRAYGAAAAWLKAEHIDVVIVLRAHLLSAASRQWLGRLALAAGVRVIAVWHGRRRGNWAEAFRHPPNLVREHDEIDAVLTATAAPTRTPAPREALPTSAALPVTGLAHFRADARRTLPATQFQAVDAHYRHGLQAACRWITGHRLTLALAAGPAQRADAHQPCLGHALGRGRNLPQLFTDQRGLQTFLSEIAATSPARAATIARVRGAQAGLLLHGVCLQVPLELAEQRGPGLSGVHLSAQVAASIRREVANPLIAFALALTVVTGLTVEEVLAKVPAEPHAHSCELYASGGGALPTGAHYTIPLPARPILAAAFFQRQTCQPTSNLIAGVTAEQVRQAAQQAEIDLPQPAGEPAPAAWHTFARAWYVADEVRHSERAAHGAVAL